jgi:hypothetical protein
MNIIVYRDRIGNERRTLFLDSDEWYHDPYAMLELRFARWGHELLAVARIKPLPPPSAEEWYKP